MVLNANFQMGFDSWSSSGAKTGRNREVLDNEKSGRLCREEKRQMKRLKSPPDTRLVIF